MTTKKSTTKGVKGKTGSKGKADRERARRIIKSNRYGDKVSAKLRRALDNSPDTLRAILGQLDEVERKAEEHKKGAHEYASKAYSAALEHYTANIGDPFALSRLAVIYDETGPSDLHIIVTLPNVIDGEGVTEKDARGAVADAELLARTLEHHACPDAFKTAFGAIFAEHILDGSDVSVMSPQLVRVALPLVLLDRWRDHDGAGVTETEILVTLSSELVPDDAAEEIRRSISKT